MPPTEAPAQTPLAPSVEKAYYRKCIQLKRRLNELETANDEARLRRARLDRAIMKMRLERAFLLDELRKRMDHNVDGSEGSGDEGMATPPPDRPHRDKRRKQQSTQPGRPEAAPATNSFQSVAYTPPASRSQSDPSAAPPLVSGPGGQLIQANATTDDGRYVYIEPATQTSASTPYQGQPPTHGSPYGPPPSGLPSGNAPNGNNAEAADDSDSHTISAAPAVTGASTTAGSATMEENGESTDVNGAQEGGGAFKAVNS